MKDHHAIKTARQLAALYRRLAAHAKNETTAMHHLHAASAMDAWADELSKD